MLRGAPAFPVRCRVRLSPITRKPARVRTFIPKRMSLVSTAPPSVGIYSDMRCSGHLPELRQPDYAPAIRPHGALADCASKSKSKPSRQEGCEQSPGRCVVASVSLRRQGDKSRVFDPTLPADPQISRAQL